MDPQWSADPAGKKRSSWSNPPAVPAPPELDSGPRPRPPAPPRPAHRLSAATRGRHAAALKGWLAELLVLPPLQLVLLFICSFTAKHLLRDARRASGAVGGAARRPPCPLWPQHGELGALRGRAVRAAPLLRRGRPAGDLRPAAGGRRRRGRRGAAGRRRPRLPHLRGAVPRVRAPRRPPHPAALHLPAGRKGPGGEGLPPSPSGGGAPRGFPGQRFPRPVRAGAARPPLAPHGCCRRARPAPTAIRPPSRPQGQRGAWESAPASCRGWESQAQVAAQGGRAALRVCVRGAPWLPGCPCGEGWTSPMSGSDWGWRVPRS